MLWKILLAGIVIFAITLGILFVGKEIADFIFGKGHYKEKEGGDK